MYAIPENQVLCNVVSRELANGFKYVFCEEETGDISEARVQKFLDSEYGKNLIELPELSVNYLSEKIYAMIYELEDPTTLYWFNMLGNLIMYWAIEQTQHKFDLTDHPWKTSVKEDEMAALIDFYYSSEAKDLLYELGIEKFYESKSDEQLIKRAYDDFMVASHFPEYNQELNGGHALHLYNDMDFLTYSTGETLDPEMFHETGEVLISGSYRYNTVEKVEIERGDPAGYNRIVNCDDFYYLMRSYFGISPKNEDAHLVFSVLDSNGIHFLDNVRAEKIFITLREDFAWGPYDNTFNFWLKVRSLLKLIPGTEKVQKVVWRYAMQTAEKTAPGITEILKQNE